MGINNKKYRLPLGFAIPLIMMIALVFVGLDNMASIQSRLKEIVEVHDQKTAIITKMRFFARERTIVLYRIITLTDPFERDDEFMRFTSFGFQFLSIRKQFINMGINEEEKQALEKQMKLTLATVAHQNEVIDLAMGEDIEKASQLLLDYAVPGQDAVFDQLNKLMEIQQRQVANAVVVSASAYEKARALMVGLSFGALCLGLFVAVVVTRRTHKAETTLFLEKELAHFTLQAIGEGVITTDSSGRINYLNPAAESLTGWKNKSASGLPLLDVFNLVDDNSNQQLINPVSIAIKQRRIVNTTSNTIVNNKDGFNYDIEYTSSPILNSVNEVTGAVLVFRNLTAIQDMAKQMSHQATHDALTDLINRHEFEDRLENALQSARSDGSNHVLCFFDLDQFKVVNDTCGHVAGDELLKQLVNNLNTRVRKSDTFARLGGDEFALLLDDCSMEGAVKLANTILQCINDFRFVWEDKSFVVGASFGMVSITPSSGTITDLIGAADSACYVAKDSGRNRIHVYKATDSILAQRRGEMQWLPLIREALENDGFILYGQKIQDLNDNTETGVHYETLVRMVRADGTHIPPMAFIPAAERYHLMPSIDRWVIKSAFEQLRRFHLKNLDNEQFWTINLSGQSLCDDDFLDYIIEQFNHASISPRLVCFEITETAAVKNLSRAIEFMAKLKSMGCQFALDDFGSGLSSFTYLKKLPVDYLKIDGSFVKDMLDDPIDMAMVESINQIGHIMNLKTIAEFVEDEATLEKLREMTIDFGQGYCIHRPQPMEEILESAKLPVQKLG